MPKKFKKQSKVQMVRGRVKVDSGSAISGRYVVHGSGTPSASETTKLRKPRSGILHGEDPTLAKRVEEELHTFGR